MDERTIKFPPLVWAEPTIAVSPVVDVVEIAPNRPTYDELVNALKCAYDVLTINHSDYADDYIKPILERLK